MSVKPFLALTSLALLSGMAYAQTPVIRDSDPVLNAASFMTGIPITAGELISIFGTNLASQPAQADTIPISTNLGKVSVTINGVDAPLLYVSQQQINAEVPWESIPAGMTGSVPVVVTANGVSSTATMMPVGAFSPGVFTINNHAVAIIATSTTDPRYGTLAAPPGSIAHLTTNRAHPGDVLEVLATGVGQVNPPGITGNNSITEKRKTVATPVVLIGGSSAHISFSGLSPQFVGVYQLNVVVPQIDASDTVPLQIQMGGITSPATSTIAVDAP